jgi:DNA-binding MarR family transcriptional regulator
MSFELIPGVWRLEITSAQKLVLFAVANFADKRGKNCYAAQSTLAKMCAMSTRTVSRRISELIDLGFVEKSGRGRAGTTRLNICENVKLAAKQARHARRSNPPNQAARPDTPVVESYLYTIKEPSNKSSRYTDFKEHVFENLAVNKSVNSGMKRVDRFNTVVKGE